MNALITGITGFVGSHLAEYLLQNGISVSGTLRWRSRTENIDSFKEKLELIHCDIRDPHSVQHAIAQAKPDVIFHLAAQSFVPTSWDAPTETLNTNIVGTLNILEAIRKLNVDPVVQMACSSEEYGLVHPSETPINEKNELRPLSPYGVSKLAQEKLAIQYYHSYGIKTVITRAFNHEGPRRGEVFVLSNFAKQIVEIEKGVRKPFIDVGNLDSIRDFTDVRDMVRAYYLATQKCKYGEAYNVCSNNQWKIRDALNLLIGLSKTKGITSREDPSRMRPSDVVILIGDYTKFKNATGWEPRIPLEQTAKDLLDYWRQRI